MAVDYNKLQHSSLTNYQKIHMNGSVSVPAVVTDYTIAHNLGYVPFFRLWGSQVSGAVHRIFNNNFSDFPNDMIVTADNNNIYITTNNSAAMTVYYRIYIDG